MNAEPVPSVAEALVDFARGLGSYRTVDDVLGQLGDICTRYLPVDGVGVLLLDDRELVVATTNSEVGEKVETLEVELGEGPCVECIRTGHPVLVPDLAQVVDRYPEFAPRAMDAGARAIFGLPLTGRGEMLGSLNIVRTEPGHVPSVELAIAQMLADVSVSYIFAVRMHEEKSRLADQLQSALDSRVIIEQAKGVLAERHGESMDRAFERLRRQARSSQRKLRTVALEVIEDRLQI